MSNVRETSIDAYHDLVASGKVKTQKDRVFHFLQVSGKGMSRSELHELINAYSKGMRLSSMTARVKELIDEGLLEDIQTRKCRVTKRTVHVLNIAHNTQLKLV